ncbi:selenium metabolism-associated LysR family transcriptional regulator [Bacillus horti]|uniref:DNA-binding transcriptional LysR family regulator n=1 Tax=Caldalkalibacillus horti TaxID=77523 RepID=A0ABT9VYA7_9BACI|nr:selenium metabolism-associated LysR family transcriptional regulator [Bacillus horti]MDQ0165963.1 DNA-binding transcriptional LysR family regulator [Bacillus horti]
MNIEHLKVFTTAATQKSFSDTAKLLHVSQPTVSMQIQQLEAMFQVKLFERTTKKVELTESGKILFHYAQQILQLLNKAEKDLAQLTSSVHGSLHIGASLTTGEYVIPTLLGDFKKAYPNVSLLVELFNSNEIIKKLTNGAIDIGFIEAPISHPDLVFHPFMEDELVVITSSKDPKLISAEKDSISVTELFQLPFIIREEGSGTRKVMEDSFSQHKLPLDKLNIILELASTESIKSMVESGAGISVISKAAIKKELMLGSLRTVPIQGVSFKRSFSMVHGPTSTHSSATEAFLNFASDHWSSM